MIIIDNNIITFTSKISPTLIHNIKSFYIHDKKIIYAVWETNKLPKVDNKLAYMYLLTPHGLEEKSSITLRFLKAKLQKHAQLQSEINMLLLENQIFQNQVFENRASLKNQENMATQVINLPNEQTKQLPVKDKFNS